MEKNEKFAFIIFLSASLLLIPFILALFFHHFFLICFLLFIVVLLILGGIYKIIQISPLLKKQGVFLIVFGFSIVGWFFIISLIMVPTNLVYLLLPLIPGIILGSAFYSPGIYYVNNYKKFHEKYITKENVLGIVFLVFGLYLLFFAIVNIYPPIMSVIFIIIGIILIRKKKEENSDSMQTTKVN